MGKLWRKIINIMFALQCEIWIPFANTLAVNYRCGSEVEAKLWDGYRALS